MHCATSPHLTYTWLEAQPGTRGPGALWATDRRSLSENPGYTYRGARRVKRPQVTLARRPSHHHPCVFTLEGRVHAASVLQAMTSLEEEGMPVVLAASVPLRQELPVQWPFHSRLCRLPRTVTGDTLHPGPFPGSRCQGHHFPNSPGPTLQSLPSCVLWKDHISRRKCCT